MVLIKEFRRHDKEKYQDIEFVAIFGKAGGDKWKLMLEVYKNTFCEVGSVSKHFSSLEGLSFALCKRVGFGTLFLFSFPFFLFGFI